MYILIARYHARVSSPTPEMRSSLIKQYRRPTTQGRGRVAKSFEAKHRIQHYESRETARYKWTKDRYRVTSDVRGETIRPLIWSRVVSRLSLSIYMAQSASFLSLFLHFALFACHRETDNAMPASNARVSNLSHLPDENCRQGLQYRGR
jgi:hypothetical protein